MKNVFRILAMALIGASALASCNSLEVTMPVGPRGEQGIQGVPGKDGKDGLSAYELWVKAVQEKLIDYTGSTDINHFFLYLKGKDGNDGKNGDTPYIKDGNWWIGDKDTGVKAAGTDGKNGKSAYELWKEYVASGVDDPHNPGYQWDKSRISIADFYWFLTGNNGADGLIPYIKDGNWWIGDKDTGVKARGDKGDKGDAGKDGVDGQSAYEMWKVYVKETIESGGKVVDQNGNEITLDDLSILKFFQYLTGKAGSKGDSGADGKDGTDGKDGKDGLTPEIDPKTGEWIIVNKETRDTIYTHISAKGRDGQDGADGKDGSDGKDGTDGKDGADGKDGISPKVGENGNWWIGDIDTGVKAQGPKGDAGSDGKDGADGKDGNDGKDGADGKDGTDGKDGADGSNGRSAYELWVADVTSAAGLEDPKSPGAKWDPSKTSLSDFYEYLRGAAGANGDTGADGKDGVDGKDGSDGKDGADGKDGVDGKDGADGSNGKSAYDLWKELVLSEEGLDNPDNGVYDISIFPKWPTFAVSLSDFYEYLRGRNGEDGEPGEKIAATDTMYVEEADWTKYNVAPVRALAKVRMNGAVKDTTYEYVNPYSGGCALVVTGPGPVIIPDCTVRFKDQTGRSYTKTSDASGYIYLERDALPDWVEGSPSIYDLSSRTKPESFSFGEKTISDPDRIAATCGVPYKVGMSVRMTGSSWEDGYVTADYLVTRTVEGIEESGWGGLSFPQCSGGGLGYFYYRSLGDLMSFRKYSFGRLGQQPNDYSQGDHFIKFSTRDVVRRWSRPVGTVASERTEPVIFGDGKAPSVVGIHHIPVSGSGQAAIYSDYLPDYGIQSASASETIIPEYCTIGALDVSGLKGGKGDAAFTSDNDKLVMSADGTEKVAVNRTNYELILGQTSFGFSFDYSTFGHVYLKKSYYDESSDVYRFRRYDTFVEYLAATKPSDSGSNVTTLAISGMLGGVSIKNTVGVSLYVSNGNIQAASRGPFIIRNVYNNFELQFVQFKYRDAYYGKTTGKFRYKETDPYVASCTLGDDTYTFQAIKDGVSAPLP